MSTLKTTVIQNPSSGTANITLGTSGQVTFGGAVTGSGMDLINTTTFSAVSAVSLNNVFTSTYENYRVVLTSVGTSAGTVSTYLRLRISGTDATTLYARSGMYAGTGGTGTFYATSESYSVIGDVANAVGNQVLDILRPALVAKTGLNGISGGWGSSSGYAVFFANYHDSATAYDGFTIYPNSGTFTGTVRVYGYRNS